MSDQISFLHILKIPILDNFGGFWPICDIFGPGGPRKALRGLIWYQLLLVGSTGWTTFISCALAPYGTSTALLGPPKALILAPKGSFGGTGGPRLAPGVQIWAQLLPIGPTEMYSLLQHTLAWYWVSLGPQKVPILAQNAPFGDPGGHRRAPEGQIWSQLPPIEKDEKMEKCNFLKNLQCPDFANLWGDFWHLSHPKKLDGTDWWI